MLRKNIQPTFWNMWAIFSGGMFLGFGSIFCVLKLPDGAGFLDGMALAGKAYGLPALAAGLLFAVTMLAVRRLFGVRFPKWFK